MKILHLTIKKKWFDMILSGEKKEEYREIKPYWNRRLLKPITYDTSTRYADSIEAVYYGNRDFPEPQPEDFYKFDAIMFYNGGYCSDRLPHFLIELKKIKIGIGKKEWGANDKAVYILELGKIMIKINKKHKIKALRDIVACVNNGNEKTFIQDFVSWLEMTITIKELVKKSGVVGDECLLNQKGFCEFQWIDDGKNDCKLELEGVGEINMNNEKLTK